MNSKAAWSSVPDVLIHFLIFDTHCTYVVEVMDLLILVVVGEINYWRATHWTSVITWWHLCFYVYHYAQMNTVWTRLLSSWCSVIVYVWVLKDVYDIVVHMVKQYEQTNHCYVSMNNGDNTKCSRITKKVSTWVYEFVPWLYPQSKTTTCICLNSRFRFN